MPPSSDAFTKPQLPSSGSSRRKRGRQPGSPGSGLALAADPDEVVDLFPPACGLCHGALDAAGSLGFVRRQCRDVPLVTVRVTETRWHTVSCRCGAVTSAPVPADVPHAPCYGPNLQALAVYLVVHQHMPVQRAAELIADLTGAAVSTGWIASQMPKAAALVAPTVKLIRALLTLGHVLHADESTTRIGGKQAWLHVACTEKLTFLALAPRSRQGARSLGVLPQFRGTLVHDALALYDGFPDARHQLCASHVIRELTALHEQHRAEWWAEQIRWALARLIEQARRARAAGLDHIPPEQAEIYLRVFHQGVAVGLSRHPRTPGHGAQSDATNVLERLRERAHDYLRFVHHLHVPATNNQSERDLRPVKTQVKISGCHQSTDRAAHWLTLRSYLSSAIKHGVSAFDAIHSAMTGTPWLPPITLETSPRDHLRSECLRCASALWNEPSDFDRGASGGPRRICQSTAAPEALVELKEDVRDGLSQGVPRSS
jgi:transposase